MRVLAIDTSSPVGFVAAVEDGIVVSVHLSDRPTSHAERLVGMLQRVLAEAGWGQGGPELVAVGRGPGSFTGVRVGLATAKGWAYARGCPVVGVVSLDAMAHAARKVVGALPGAAFLDAKKGEVFAALYDSSGGRLVEPAHLPRGETGRWLSEAERVTATACAWIAGEDLESLGGHAGVRVDNQEARLPCASSVAALAVETWRRERRDELLELDPLYVRPPDIQKPAARSTAGAGSA